jgi:hypothetical protein
MKISILKKSLVAGLAVASLAVAPQLRANTELFIEGGSASSSVLFQAATNILNGGAITVPNNGNSSVRTFVGSSTLPTLSTLGTITLDYNLNGAVIGLQNLVNHTTDTNILGALQVPDLVDSATLPESVLLSSAGLKELPTYVVPLVFIKNTNSIDTAAITNLTQRQAVTLETSATNPATFFGGTNGPNPIYFVGRNSQAAVRTIIDLVIYNGSQITSYLTNALGQPIYDTNSDPGLQFGGAVANTVVALTNSIGTVSVQNIVKGTAAIPYEGVPYSAANVINGSYPLWGHEHYYYKTTAPGIPASDKLAVINALYQQVTNDAFQVTSVFTNKFIPNKLLRVDRAAGNDGGPIFLLPGY